MRWARLCFGGVVLSGCAGIPETARVNVSADGREEIYVRSVVDRDGHLRERRVEWIAQPDPPERCERTITETLSFGRDGRATSRVIERQRCRVVVSHTTELFGDDGEVVAWEVAIDIDNDGHYDYRDWLPGPDTALSLVRARQLQPGP